MSEPHAEEPATAGVSKHAAADSPRNALSCGPRTGNDEFKQMLETAGRPVGPPTTPGEEKMPKMTGAQVMADMLKGYGVTHVFQVPAVLRTTQVELEKRTDIKRLHVHSEATAAYMADGYARASGRPGVCMAQVIGDRKSVG